MRVLFTDIDGVYNTPAMRDRHRTAIDLEQAWKTGVMCRYEGIHVVVSSSWREDYPVEARALPFPFHSDWRTILRPDRMRGLEIAEWLSRHPEVTSFGIFDDRADMLPEQMPRFIQTDNSIGVTDDQIETMRKIILERNRVYA